MAHTVRLDNNINFQSETVDSGLEKPKRKLTTKQMIGLGMATIMATGAAVAGGIQIANHEKQTNPLNKKTDQIEKNIDSSVPAEARQFVSQYGDRFNDPVATYYSEQEYEELSHNKSLMISNEAIANYDMSAQPTGEISPLVGFEKCKLPADTTIDTKTAVAIFNNYTSKELSLYLNCLAKNPSPEAQAVIDYEFKNYCSNSNAFAGDSEYTDTLMQTMHNLVRQFGSSTEYYIGKGALQTNIEPGDTLLSNSVYNQGEEAIDHKTFSNQAILKLKTITISEQGSATTGKYTSINGMFIMYNLDSNLDLSLGQLGQTEPVVPGQ